ncbi:abnormal cell migration protein 10-like isoform X2 [Paramacrobiotus metropolitanus]|uniref:abnormal cell migration protein 10-like isoform X2 n=1 Tax=Paramacrobiotus metropolitanus TaxID=2943436 RepID=UPI002446123E|nr:abnormal cell migration protein 10-like isoform X2 [Paramacrobiotus metropolitanus]XP_055351697.1 abnormal cell migration protein 10-like isoform X2 [Paramacrobiotus metropolitanus]
MPLGKRIQLQPMTSLPVVVEDTTDTDIDITDNITDSSADYCQEVLQHTLDLCLENLDKIQLLPATECRVSAAAAADNCPDFSMVGQISDILTTVDSGKSDSGFWSQSFDNYRSSMATVEDSVEDVDLDAILGELCALGDELENERRRTVEAVNSSSTHATAISALAPASIAASRNSLVQDVSKIPSKFSPNSIKPPLPQKPHFEEALSPGHHSTMNQMTIPNGKSISPVGLQTHASGGAGAVECFDLVEHYYKQVGANADSPDNDSAFSDNVSCISSESGASRTDASCMSSGSSKSSNGSLNAPSPTQRLTSVARLASISEVGEKENISPTTIGSGDGSALAKAEKTKIALEKINDGDSKTCFVTVHFNDELRKSLSIDDRMECLDVCQSLAERSDTKLTPDCTIVEYLPELHIERFFEDHENLVENYLMWDRDSKNKLLYVERKDKYHFIVRPEVYLVGFACKDTDYDELSRRALLKDYFSSHAISPPELENYLYLKTDKKAWKRYWFVLRSSGLYYSTKPKAKQTSSADLICLTAFDAVNLYRGLSWKKKHKAPTDYGFALKLPQIQSAKALKNIRFICTDDQASLELWMTGIRIAKHGRHLIENFNKALERAAAMEAAQESNNSSAQQTPVLNRRHPNDPIHPQSNYGAFDDEPPTGTIKRKPPHTNPPSSTPKLPFTPKTSQLLMRNADERRSFSSQSSRTSVTSHSDLSEPDILPPPPPELLSPTMESLPLSPTLLRSPPPTPPKPAALQRKPSLDGKKPALESRHSIGPSAASANQPVSNNLPFLHELKTKSQSPLVTKKVLAVVPEVHDILSQPSSPARMPVASPSPVMPSSPARIVNGHAPRPQSMSPSHKAKLPPPPPRRSDMTKLNMTDAERKEMGYSFERSVSLGNEALPVQRLASPNPAFMADLVRMLAQKKRHSLLLNESQLPEGSDYLPPPPPELLRGISSPVPSCSSDESARRRPPPPPKRSDGTYLTRGK